MTISDEEKLAYLDLARSEGYVIYKFSTATWTWIKGDDDGGQHETTATFDSEATAGGHAWQHYEYSKMMGYCVCCKCMDRRDHEEDGDD